MSAAQTAAANVAKELVQSRGYATETVSDASWILLIVDILTELINGCNMRSRPEAACSDCNNPGLIQSAVLRGKVRQAMGRQAYRAHGEDVVEALKNYGKTLDVATLQQIIEDVQ